MLANKMLVYKYRGLIDEVAVPLLYLQAVNLWFILSYSA